MKNIYILFGSLIIFFIDSGLYAQQIYNNVYIYDVKANQTKDILCVEMFINGSKAQISSNEKIILTPVIKAGNNSKELKSLVISGNARYKADKRIHFFKHNLNIETTSLKVAETSSINFKQNILYEHWMKDASLYMKELIMGCAECLKIENEHIIADRIQVESVNLEKPSIKFEVQYITPETETVKNRDYEGSAFLEFQVGKSVIIPEFRDNYTELNKIENVLNQLKTDNNARIKKISLTGFASPEGSYQTNSRLSTSRAQALKVYLQKRFNYEEDLFQIEQGGEDWNGLKELVLKSDLPEKDKITNVMNSSELEDAKEQRLKGQGTVYKTLLDEYFPKLRRVNYKLDYVVRAFSVEEGKVIIKLNPGQMSLNEMFLVANNYDKGSQNFKDVFDIAVRMHPQNVVANINAAAIALEDGNTNVAHLYLDPYQHNPVSWNNQGVLYALENDLKKARVFFLKAQTEGVSEASANLKKLELLENYENKIKK